MRILLTKNKGRFSGRPFWLAAKQECSAVVNFQNVSTKLRVAVTATSGVFGAALPA